MREERVEVGYHVFVALQDLYFVRDNILNSLSEEREEGYLLERGQNVTVIFLVKRLGRE